MYKIASRICAFGNTLLRFFITRYYQSTQCDLKCTVTIFVIKIDEIDDDVADGCPNITISWETRNLAGVVVRTDRTRYIVRAKAVGVRLAGRIAT